jgi:DNA helicase-2/ATP-dependent DNA helicase PcrA
VSFDEICSAYRVFITSKQIIDDNDFFAIKKLLHRTLKESVIFENDLEKWLKYINDSINFVDVFKSSDRYPDEIDNLKSLKSVLHKQQETLSIKFLSRLGMPENQVVLSTRHSSKGLEFDVVIMIGMEKDSFPSYYDNTQRKLDEARRLCFVAVSRARKACVLIRSMRLPNKYGKWFNKEPSPFWTVLKEFQEKTFNKKR